MRSTNSRPHPHATFLVSRFAACAVLAMAITACDDDQGDDASDGVADDGGADVPDPNCDALLTPGDFATVCGAELTLEPTGFEGIDLNPCSRTAESDEAILLVTRHTNADTAMAAAGVAGGRGPNLQEGLGLYASAGARSVFTIEVKATDRTDAICQPDDLPTLLDVALDRVVE